MTPSNSIHAKDSLIAEIRTRSLPRWLSHTLVLFALCFPTAGSICVVLRSALALDRVQEIVLELWRSGDVAGASNTLLSLAMTLVVSYACLVLGLSCVMAFWHEPGSASTYRITDEGVVWEVGDKPRVIIPWSEVGRAFFTLPGGPLRPGATTSSYREVHQALLCMCRILVPLGGNDKRAFTDSFDPDNPDTFRRPMGPAVFFIGKGSLNCYVGRSVGKGFYLMFFRLFFLGDYSVGNGYVSSIRGDCIRFMYGLPDDSDVSAPASPSRRGETAKREHLRKRRDFFWALAEGLMRNGFTPVFK